MSSKEQEEIPLNPDADGDLSSETDGESFHYVPPRRRRLGSCRCFGWALALTALIVVSGIAGAWISMAFLNIDQNCAAHTTQWCKSGVASNIRLILSNIDAAPLLDDVAITYKTVEFDGKFMNENVFRRNASPEVDAAWESLGVDGMSSLEVLPQLLTWLSPSWCHLLRGWYCQWPGSLLCPAQSQIWRRLHRERRGHASPPLLGMAPSVFNNTAAAYND